MITLPYTGNYTFVPLVGNEFDMRMSAGDYDNAEFTTIERIEYINDIGMRTTIHVNLPLANQYNTLLVSTNNMITINYDEQKTPLTVATDGSIAVNYNRFYDRPVGRYYPSLDETKTIISEQFKNINPKDLPALEKWLLTFISPIKNLPVQEGGNI